jgi:hypothetical protein
MEGADVQELRVLVGQLGEHLVANPHHIQLALCSVPHTAEELSHHPPLFVGDELKNS